MKDKILNITFPDFYDQKDHTLKEVDEALNGELSEKLDELISKLKEDEE